MRRTTLVALLFACLAGFLAGCNTISGIGQDLESAGGAISDTAEKTKRNL